MRDKQMDGSVDREVTKWMDVFIKKKNSYEPTTCQAVLDTEQTAIVRQTKFIYNILFPDGWTDG